MKSPRKLPIDVTLRSLTESLAEPMEFVRCVFGNMEGYFRDCQVRLATDSNAKRPDYLIEMLFYDHDDDGIEVEHAQSIAVFKGRSHAGALSDSENTRRLWSLEAMKWEEVQELLGELRGIKPRAAGA